MYYLYSILWLLLVQTKATSASGSNAAAVGDVTASTGEGGTASAQAPSFFDSMILYLPLALAMMLVYMIMMKPPKGGGSGKSLDFKKNDQVVTAGGVVGTVVKNDPESEVTTLRVDDSGNTKMQFLTSSIVKVLSDEKDKENSSSDKK